MAAPQLRPTSSSAENPFSRPCPNCGGKDLKLYCAACGQKAPDYTDYSVWLKLKAFVVADLIAYDGRIWGTLGALLIRPGKLTREYFDGRRARYLGPMRIFVLANVALWFLSPYLKIRGFNLEVATRYAIFSDFWLGLLHKRAELAKISVAQMTARVEAVSAAENQLAVLCLGPLVAIGLSIALAGRGYRYLQHLIFAAHFFVLHIGMIVLSWGLVLIPLYFYGAQHPEMPLLFSFSTAWRASNTFQHMSVALPLFPLMFVAVRRAYALSTREALWRAVFATVFACLVTRSFFDVAFALVLLFA